MLALFVVLSFGEVLIGQNLVINPSFESYSTCPDYVHQFDFTNYWHNPTVSSPDLYNTCGGPQSPVYAGQNLVGTQQAHTGFGYAGLIPYALPLNTIGCDNSIINEYKEYIQGKLTIPLISGKKYCVSFWISLAELSRYGTRDIGVYFSNNLINKTYEHELNVTPQLQNKHISLDSFDWQKLEWTYIAKGGERYITIGNFKKSANTNVFPVNCSAPQGISYYYIDDVSVVQGNCQNCTILFDKTKNVCKKDGMLSAIAVSGIAPYTYHWSNGAKTSDIFNLEAGTYWVTVSGSDGCKSIDSISIDQRFAPTIAPYINTVGVKDTSIYVGDTLFFASGNDQTALGVTYSWNAIEALGHNFGFLSSTMEQTLAIPPYNGVYKVKLTATAPGGCVDNDYLQVIVQGEYNGIPNAFSPNGDGTNDYFRPIGLNYTEIIDFSIYNRWGQKLYTNYPTSKGWDGTYNGIEQPAEVYFYVLRFQQEGMSEKNQRGAFTLIR